MLVQFPNKKEENKNSNLRASGMVLDRGSIHERSTTATLLPIVFQDNTPAKRSSAAEPIKSVEDIVKVQDWLIEHGRYRDNLLFTMGINVGLRCGDLLKLKVGHLITADGKSYKDSIELLEEKTGKRRVIYLNDAVCDAADLYFSHCEALDPNSYLFHGEGNRSKNMNQPLSMKTVDRILKEVINDQLQLPVHASTHCLRKTFAYHMIMTAPDRSRAIEFLMKVLGHSSASITLMYAGITDEEMRETYKALNLGRRNPLGFYRSAV